MAARDAARKRTAKGGEGAGGGRRTWLLGAALVLVIVALVLVFARYVGEEDLRRLGQELRSFGDRWWAPLALIAAFVVVSVTGLPGTPLTLAAGAAWGWLKGGAWVMVAILVGTAVPYLIARSSFPRLRRAIERRFGGIRDRIEREGLTGLLILRALHVIPFAILSYASGLVDMRPRDYFVATFLGTLPGVLVYTYLADALLDGLVSKGDASVRVLVAGVLVVALVLATRLLARRFRR